VALGRQYAHQIDSKVLAESITSLVMARCPGGVDCTTGRKPPVSIEAADKPRTEAPALHLTPGKMNAVRAAFKVGVKPSQIARQFGLSQSDVRTALASDAPRRAPDRNARLADRKTRANPRNAE
jgi:hypothetical protein